MTRGEDLPVAPVALREGDRMPEARIGPLTRTDFVRYAGASGDFHPLHHDEEYALAAGMPSVFAMGMLHAGMLGNRLARWVGPENVRSFGVRFTAQVWPGDCLAFNGQVTGTSRDGDTELAEIALEVTSQKGERVLTAQATAAVAGVAPGPRES